MSIVVSDTSPIRAFHFLKQTDILRVLFATVIIPPAVASELAHPHRAFDPLDLSAIQFIEVRAPHDQQRVAQYAAALDLGEAEAIVLAIELGSMLLVDEIDGHGSCSRWSAVRRCSGSPCQGKVRRTNRRGSSTG